MTTLERKCPHCGSAREVPEGERAPRCSACGKPLEHLYVAARNPRPRQQPPNDLAGNLFVPFAMAMLGITTMAIVASIAAIFVNQANANLARARFAHRQTHVAPAIPAPQAPARSTVWYEPEPAIPIELHGKPGFAGLFAREQGRIGHLFLGAFDANGAPLWTSEPLGFTADSTLYLHLAASGGRIAVTDARPSVRVFSAADGAPQYALPLPARATGICGGPGGRVYLELASAPGRLLDLAAARAVPAPRPSWCPAPPDARATPRCAQLATRVRTHARCAEPTTAIDGLRAEWLLREGELAVAVGRDAEKTPVLIGLAENGRERWRLPLTDCGQLPLLVDLVRGEVLVKAESPRAPFHPWLLSLDARTGRVLWKTELPREEHAPPPALTVADQRVYVATEGQLQILDARTGALVGTVGD